SSDKLNIGNAFLSKELAEIFAIRQRCERAWHARLIIFTTTISSFNNTLACCKDEIEKEEAAAFKAYLQLAIANFGALDSSPTPPKIPSHSRPTRGSSHELRKDKTIGKKAAVVIPRSILSVDPSVRRTQVIFSLPKAPQAVEYSWAIVAPLMRKAAISVSNKDKPTTRASTNTATSDRRLFVRLALEHEWRKLSPAGIHEPVYSGSALWHCSTILNAGNGLFLSGAKLEAATNWITVIVPTVPSSIRKEQGEVVVSKSMLIDEIERVCSRRPAHEKLYSGNKDEAPPPTELGWRIFPKPHAQTSEYLMSLEFPDNSKSSNH
ncbi:hypothetical protein EPUL_005852, partial [Erysiphe pulchra]